MNYRISWIALCSLLMIVMTACNLSANNDNETILLTSDASTVIAASQPEVDSVEATAEVTEPVTEDVINTSNTDTQETTINQQPANNSSTSIQNTNTTTVNASNISCTPRTDWVTYAVQSGDTLGQIASRTGSTVANLTQANCLTNANILTVGQQLYVPRTPSTANGSNDVVIVSTDKTCQINFTARTAVYDLPTGVPNKVIDYIEAGTSVQPMFKYKGINYYAIHHQGITGLVNIAPVGNCTNLPEQIVIDDPSPDICRIFVNARTEIVDLPQGTSATILGYLSAGSVVEPTVQISALKTYGFNYNGQTGWINIQPTGDCSQLPDLYDQNDDDNRCLIHVNARTEVVNAPQGTGRTILGYLPAGSVVEPTIHFEGLSYYGFNYQGQTGWIDGKPTGDCSNLQNGPDNEDDPSPAACTIKTAHSLQGYALPDASSTVVDTLLANIGYEVIGKRPASWYKVKFPESGMEGWVQAEASGNCNNLSGQVYDCQFVGDTRVPIYRNPEIGSDQLDTLEQGDVYRFGKFGGEWTSGDVTGYWIEVFYQNHRPLAGYIQNTGGHLEGSCPSR